MRRFTLIPIALLAVTLLTGCAEDETQTADGEVMEAPTEPAETAEASVIAAGRVSYEQYCQSCHGAEGAGDGPVADDLEAQPPDLRRLTIRHDGTFPRQAIVEMVDGTTQVAAHGTREMPVWGNIWSEDLEGNEISPEVAEQRIEELVAYLRSIQVEA